MAWPDYVVLIAYFCLMAGSYIVGHQVGTDQATGIIQAMQAGAPGTAALSIDQAGAIYLSALRDVALYNATASYDSRLESRREALSTIYAAADEMLRIAPDDRVSSYILQAFDQVPGASSRARADSTRIIWF